MNIEIEKGSDSCLPDGNPSWVLTVDSDWIRRYRSEEEALVARDALEAFIIYQYK